MNKLEQVIDDTCNFVNSRLGSLLVGNNTINYNCINYITFPADGIQSNIKVEKELFFTSELDFYSRQILKHKWPAGNVRLSLASLMNILDDSNSISAIS